MPFSSDFVGPRSRGLAILETEVSVMITALKKTSGWNRSEPTSSSHPTLLQPFLKLKTALAERGDMKTLDDMDPVLFLNPFLDVIRCEVVTGPVTGQALDAVHKFLSYELLHCNMPDAVHAVENLADAVTHARFVGVDPSSDEVVLMKILSVLRTLILTPVGLLLTNESICEIMQSTFRICFETRLSSLLRKTAELALTDMIQLLFTRLPTFSEENLPLLKKLKMRNNGISSDGKSGRRYKSFSSRSGSENRKKHDPKKYDSTRKAVPPSTLQTLDTTQQPSSDCDSSLLASPSSSELPRFDVDADVLARSPVGSVTDLSTCVQSDVDEPDKQVVSDTETVQSTCETIASTEAQTESTDCDVGIMVTSPGGTSTFTEDHSNTKAVEESPISVQTDGSGASVEEDKKEQVVEESNEKQDQSEFVNAQGVTFQPTAETIDETGSLIPYGLPCLRELFRFLVSIINPHELSATVAGSAAANVAASGAHQNEWMIQIALSLLATALETGAEYLDKYESLLELVKDDLVKNLVALLTPDRKLSTFSSALWITYMVFATQRKYLKYQMEIYLTRLMDIVSSESSSSTEHKELVLEHLVRFYKIPGFISEIYLNYDCDLYTNNVFEDLTKMLSKNAFPLTGLYNTHLLSLEALLTVVEAIERQSRRRVLGVEWSKDKPFENGHARGVDLNVADKPDVPCLGLRGSGHLAGKMSLKNAIENEREEEEPDEGLVSADVMTHEELMALKNKKKLIRTATDQFNTKPAKGIAYLQEVGLLSSPLDVNEVAGFLRANPHLDKKHLGDYLANRKNLSILGAFVQSFDFVGLRIDESLRVFLESFRLPGEAPLITLILEHFSDHWHKSSGGHTYVANADSAFTLSYAVIMLNVDQHNKNHTRTNDPMTLDQFRRNVRGTNNGGDHDQDMLAEIYHAIRNEEIVMPAEQTGLVKENYLWKCALKRGQESNHASGRPKMLMTTGDVVMFDHDLFCLTWGPTLAALCYVFDKSRPSSDDLMIEKCLSGFNCVASVAGYYRMSDVMDNLVVSLAKFSTLQNVTDLPIAFVPIFGSNVKAKIATRAVFKICHKHANIFRDSWKNILEIMLQLFKCELLDKNLMEAEDYVEAAGRVKLLREKSSSTPSVKVESGFLNSFVSFISMSSETSGNSSSRPRTLEEDEAASRAFKLIQDCHVESLVTESKFLLVDSLKNLIDHLVEASALDFGPSKVESGAKTGEKPSRSGAVSPCRNDDDQQDYDEHATVFFMEILVRITIQNRDRVSEIWSSVSDHLVRLIMAAASGLSMQTSNDQKLFLLERSVTSLMRLAVRLGRKEDLASPVVQSLKTLLGLKTSSISQVSRHISFGMYEMLRNNAANIHETTDWDVVFSIIETVGAGANPSDMDPNTKARGACDDDISGSTSSDHSSGVHDTLPHRERSNSVGSSSGGWIVLGSNSNSEEKSANDQECVPNSKMISFSSKAIIHPRTIVMHDSLAFLKSCESMAFLIRDVAHITPLNFARCVQALRTFVEASFVERPDENALQLSRQLNSKDDKQVARSAIKKTPGYKSPSSMRRVRSVPSHQRRASPASRGTLNSSANSDYDADESDSEDLSSEYHHVALQLIDLMSTLHIRAAQIFKEWAEENNTVDDTKAPKNLWPLAWCPLLQGTARLCCDKRSHIRTSALTSLQRALLFFDLQTFMSALEWEASFTRVLFPMLTHLLLPSQPGEKTAMEETRTRASTLLGKVFLQHLAPLATLPSFTSLWMTIIDFMDKFIKAATSDLLSDAVPESLKNMLLVMDTAGVFQKHPPSLWQLTCDKLDEFLPNLIKDLFGEKMEPSSQVPEDLAREVNRSQKDKDVEKEPEIEDKALVVQDEKSADAAVEGSVPDPNNHICQSAEQSRDATEEPTNEGDSKPDKEDIEKLPAELSTEMQTSSDDPNGKEPPVSPNEPPLASPGFFIPKSDLSTSFQMSYEEASTVSRLSFKPTYVPPSFPAPTVLTLPSRPTIGPMPPPPPGVLNTSALQNFQPIHAALPTHGATGIQVANPRPVLASYFGSSQPNLGANIVTTSFVPTLVNPTNPVVLLGGNSQSNVQN